MHALAPTERSRLAVDLSLLAPAASGQIPPMSRSPTKLLFLPGALGNTRFWRPVSEHLSHPARRKFIGWPGFGGVPSDPRITGLDALLAMVLSELTEPVAIFAQSMGGTLALGAALALPQFVTHLVLSVTSGGLDVASLGGADWRPEFRRENPDLPHWFEDARVDLTSRLRSIDIPVLLLWGNADPISPIAVGKRLQELLPNSELIVVEGGTHDLASTRAEELREPILRHLAK